MTSPTPGRSATASASTTKFFRGISWPTASTHRCTCGHAAARYSRICSAEHRAEADLVPQGVPEVRAQLADGQARGLHWPAGSGDADHAIRQLSQERLDIASDAGERELQPSGVDDNAPVTHRASRPR